MEHPATLTTGITRIPLHLHLMPILTSRVHTIIMVKGTVIGAAIIMQTLMVIGTIKITITSIQERLF